MSTISILVDGILLSASFAACFYCIQLSRRVRNLARTDQGLGKGIAEMTEAVERLNASLEQTRLAARTESETLQHRLAEARDLTERTSRLLADGDHRTDELARNLGEARQMVRTLERLADTASKRRARSGRPDWREALADGLPDREPSRAAARAFPTDRPRARSADGGETAMLLDAAALDQSEDADDPLPDVKPLGSRRAAGTRSFRNGEA